MCPAVTTVTLARVGCGSMAHATAAVAALGRSGLSPRTVIARLRAVALAWSASGSVPVTAPTPVGNGPTDSERDRREPGWSDGRAAQASSRSHRPAPWHYGQDAGPYRAGDQTAGTGTRSRSRRCCRGGGEMTVPMHLDEASIEAVASRVVEMLRSQSVDTDRELVDVAEAARRFGVSRDWVYGNADQLGAIRLGDGPKARLRFDVQEVEQRLAKSKRVERPSASTRPVRYRRRKTRESVELLPIR